MFVSYCNESVGPGFGFQMQAQTIHIFSILEFGRTFSQFSLRAITESSILESSDLRTHLCSFNFRKFNSNIGKYMFVESVQIFLLSDSSSHLSDSSAHFRISNSTIQENSDSQIIGFSSFHIFIFLDSLLTRFGVDR